jgi:Domain of Unknown Function (DUF928)
MRRQPASALRERRTADHGSLGSGTSTAANGEKGGAVAAIAGPGLAAQFEMASQGVSTMMTRRSFTSAAFGVIGGSVAGRPGLAQPSAEQPPEADGLRSRGRPTGRVGAATRGADGDITLDLVAPLRGIGLTRSDQPTLYYLLSGSGARPVRLVISTAGQARPLAELEVRGAGPAALGVLALRAHAIRLLPNLLNTWSVVVVLDPRAPSRDLVANALIQYRPADAALERAVREALPEQRHKVLAAAGYWYDAVALAEQARARDQGAALAELLADEALRPPPAGSRPSAGGAR